MWNWKHVVLLLSGRNSGLCLYYVENWEVSKEPDTVLLADSQYKYQVIGIRNMTRLAGNLVWQLDVPDLIMRSVTNLFGAIKAHAGMNMNADNATAVGRFNRIPVLRSLRKAFFSFPDEARLNPLPGQWSRVITNHQVAIPRNCVGLLGYCREFYRTFATWIVTVRSKINVKSM